MYSMRKIAKSLHFYTWSGQSPLNSFRIVTLPFVSEVDYFDLCLFLDYLID